MNNKCGCYYCMKEFGIDEITEYIDNDKDIKNALCPNCDLDTLALKSEYGSLENLRNLGIEMFYVSNTVFFEEEYDHDIDDMLSVVNEKSDNYNYINDLKLFDRYKRLSSIPFLKWVGIGSSWSKDLINTSALMIDDGNLVLIDCGSLVFNKLLKEGLLENIQNANILITHLHGDHVGSLVDLVMYLYYTKNIKPNIIFHGEEIKDLLELQGLDLNACTFTNRFIGNIDKIMNIDLGINGLEVYDVREVDHVDTLNCYSYDLMYKGKVYVFSGDIKYYPDIIEEYYNEGILGEVYLDTSVDSYPEIPHMTLDELIKRCPDKIKNHVFCTHLKGEYEYSTILESGFSIPYYI